MVPIVPDDKVRVGPGRPVGTAGPAQRRPVLTVASFGRYMIHDPVHHHCDTTGERAERV
jgi:hypothetical protein